jgi:uncharacterized RDD family membrane protein YckC
MAANEQPLDTTIDIVTPENISFRYRVAGPFRRLPAFLIDLLLRLGVGIALLIGFLITGLFAAVGGWLFFAGFLVLQFAMEWLYGGLMEAYWNGQTVGKRIMGIRVLSTDGQPISGLQAMMRNILRFVDMMPLIPWAAFTDVPGAVPIPTFMIGLLTPLFNRRFQRLGDIVCGTMVVIDEKSFFMEAVRMEDPRVAQLAAELPASFSVSRTMAKALATYVDRRQLFSPPRRREIARHLGEPLLQRFHLPADTSHDLLVCALYHRTFAGTQEEIVAMPRAHLESQTKSLTAGIPGMTMPAVPDPISDQHDPIQAEVIDEGR